MHKQSTVYTIIVTSRVSRAYKLKDWNIAEGQQELRLKVQHYYFLVELDYLISSHCKLLIHRSYS